MNFSHFPPASLFIRSLYTYGTVSGIVYLNFMIFSFILLKLVASEPQVMMTCMGTVLLFMKLDFISADHLVNDISALKCMA
jgi:hypothetical protein